MRCLILVLLIVFTCPAFSQNRLTFEHLTIEDGLANNSVRTIFQDHEGYLWFGTLNGLSRYDGQQFKTFDYSHGDSSSISNNKIREIRQDQAGFIWILTYDEHAHRFDPKTETFVNFPASLGDEFDSWAVHFIYESSPGVMWLYSTGNGCARVISSTGSPNYSLTVFTGKNHLPFNNLNLISTSKKGGLWFGTPEGFYYLPDDRFAAKDAGAAKSYLVGGGPLTTSFCETGEAVWFGNQGGEIFKMNDGKLDLFWTSPKTGQSDKSIRFIEALKNGGLCVGTGNGFLVVDGTTREKHYFNSKNSRLNTDYMNSFYHDRHDDIWLVTDQRGVTRFQPGNRQFTHYPLSPENRQSIVEGEKQVFSEDKGGNLWVGIYGGGISRFNRQTGSFEQYLHDENNQGSLSSNLILSLFEDRSGNIWAGTYKHGANKVNLQQNNFYALRTGSGRSKDFSNEVRAIFEDSRQWTWTGNKLGEVSVFNNELQKIFALNEIRGQYRISTGVYTFEEDRLGNIWIGTKGEGIYILKNIPKVITPESLKKIQMVHFAANQSSPQSLSNSDVFDLHEDQSGQMWVALYHGGLNVIRHPMEDGQQILRYLQNDNDKFAITDNRIRCLFEDNQGNLWIGTAKGLNFLPFEYVQTDMKKFQQIERKAVQGSLSNNDVVCINQSSDGSIRVGTYGNGLNQLLGLQPGGPFTFAHLGQADGLSSGIVLSMVEDDRKNIWIGTDFGLCKFNPTENSFENYYTSDGLEEHSFSEGAGIKTSGGLMLFGHISGMAWFHPDSVHKSSTQVPVVLTNLRVNGRDNKEKLSTARRLLGDSLHALELRYNENFVTFEFAALDYKAPSKNQYTFKLENYEQDWNRPGNLNKAIYRELEPGTYLFRLKASNSDGLWVNPEMKLALTIAPPPWKTAWAFLFYFLISIGLFFLARRIILERIKLKHEVEFEKQMADDKLKFYTSISHEFKTPLALILGPVEDLLAGKDMPTAIQAPLTMVKRNTHRLLQLIDQLMDFRKIQKGFFRVTRVNADVVGFLKEIYQTFLPLAERKLIGFVFKHENPGFEASFDYLSLEKIIFNLLSNAFKHTVTGQNVELKLVVDEKNSQLFISVTDDGDGIQKKDLPHIFERFSFGNRSRWTDEPDTGVGLSLVKELVELQQGSVSVESTWGKGSCFTVKLPVAADETRGETDAGNLGDLSYTRQFLPVIGDNLQAAQPSANGRMAPKETLLIVEDHPDLQAYLANHLSAKYRIFQAVNGLEGLHLAKTKNPDLIVCDIMMPKMDGIELVGLLKGEFHTSHIPIILLTAKSLEEHKIEGIKTGADDYITKPFNMVYLETRIANMLKQRKQLKERFSRDLQARPKELGLSPADQEFLEKVIQLVDENVPEPDFSVDNLLEHFNFGRTVFYKKMKGITGYSPKDFVRIERMKKAGTLLLDKDITVAEVSFKLGFNDPEYFSKLFKKHFGENPSEYQKRNKNIDASAVSMKISE